MIKTTLTFQDGTSKDVTLAELRLIYEELSGMFDGSLSQVALQEPKAEQLEGNSITEFLKRNYKK